MDLPHQLLAALGIGGAVETTTVSTTDTTTAERNAIDQWEAAERKRMARARQLKTDIEQAMGELRQLSEISASEMATVYDLIANRLGYPSAMAIHEENKALKLNEDATKVDLVQRIIRAPAAQHAPDPSAN